MRNFNINERLFVDEIDWEDDTFGSAEGTITHVTDSNHSISVTFKLTININFDEVRRETIEVEEIYVEDSFGREVELTEEEYEGIEENFKEVLEW